MGLFGHGHITVSRANKISNVTINTAEQGASVPEIFGTTRISGNVIYYGDFMAHEHKETQRAGKGGKSKSVNITYTYTVATEIALCEGPISGIGKVWIDKNVYNYPSDEIQLTLYSGTSDQPAWSYLIGKHPSQALPYHGLAYMAGVVDLGDNASLSNYNFEVKGKLLGTGDGVDANPADVIRYILDKVGLSAVTIDGLDNYRKYCAENDLLISTPMDGIDAKETREIINQVIALTNAYMFWSNDHYKIAVMDDLAHGSWTPDKTVLYNLTADDFISQGNGVLVSYSRKDSSDIYNQFPVEFINRDNSYERETVAYADTDDINTYGVRQASTTKAHWFYKKERAVKVAEALARKARYGRNQYTFKLDWSFCCLEVGDIVTLTDKNIGITKEPVRINNVIEGTDGLLTFTAVSMPPLDDVTPKFKVHNVDRPYVDYNKTAPDTDTPLIMQPPVDLTTNGLEVWIGAKGKGDLWGGCEVYISDDNTNYRYLGQITNSARIGTLASDLKADDTTVVVKSNGSFLSGTRRDAEWGNTLCWVDGECFSYQTATLQADGTWSLSGCIRGQYNTTASVHSSGAQFVRLDNTLLKTAFRRKDINKQIYLKFVSYNVFGSGNQDLAGVNPYEYTLEKYYVPPVTNLTLATRYREVVDGKERYDILVKWEAPAMASYFEGRVYYTVDNGTGDATPVFGGSGQNTVTIPDAIVGAIYKIYVRTKDKYGGMNSGIQAPTASILVALKTETPNTPQNFSITFGSVARVSWDEVTNADIAYYEVRTDKNPGVVTSGLLAKTNDFSTAITLTSRIGTLYLYAKSALGKYSAPAELTYSKAAPSAPAAPVVNGRFGMMGITTAAIPSDCIGVAAYISSGNDTTVVKSTTNVLTYPCDAGIYDVVTAYYDLFGEGTKSPDTTCTVKIEIDGSMLKDESIALDKVEKTLKEQIETGAASGSKVQAVVDNLNAKDGYKQYSALVQLQDDINLQVKNGDEVTRINLAKDTLSIEGKLIHITGTTLFDNNVITNGMIQANAVTADKISVTSLSAVSGNLGTLTTASSDGSKIVMTGANIKIYDPRGTLRVAMGVDI